MQSLIDKQKHRTHEIYRMYLLWKMEKKLLYTKWQIRRGAHTRWICELIAYLSHTRTAHTHTIDLWQWIPLLRTNPCVMLLPDRILITSPEFGMGVKSKSNARTWASESIDRSSVTTVTSIFYCRFMKSGFHSLHPFDIRSNRTFATRVDPPAESINLRACSSFTAHALLNLPHAKVYSPSNVVYRMYLLW